MKNEFEQDFQDLLQTTLNDYLERPVVVTGWVSGVEILDGDSRRFVSLFPSTQSPALTAGLVQYSKASNDEVVSSGFGYDDDEEDD